MPTYEYECLECKHRFDVFQSIKADPITKCEKCGAQVRRVITPAPIIFKGSGFYVNDYRKGNSASRPVPSDSGAESSSAAECSGCTADSCPSSSSSSSSS